MNIIHRNEPLLSAAAAIVCELRVASEEFILALNLFQTMYKREKKKKKVGAFLSALAFPRCFWHEKCYSTIKKKPHFQKYLGNRTLVKSQGSESAQKIVSAGVQSLSLVVWPCKSQLCQCNGVQVFQSYSDKEKILAWQSPCLGEISYAF